MSSRSRKSRSLRIREERQFEANNALFLKGFPTQKALAKRAEMSPDTVNRFFKGYCVDVYTVMKLCGILKLDFSQVCEECCTPQADETNPVNLPLYIERPPVEENCYQEMLKPGAFLRIKSPKYSGKKMLISHLIRRLEQEKKDYLHLVFDFQNGTDSTVLTDLIRFYQFFCRAISNQLFLPLETSWAENIGANFNVFTHFKSLLKKINKPLVLILTHVDGTVDHPQIYPDFCNLLRGFADAARAGDEASKTWQRLRLIIVHSTDVYGQFDINASPLAGAGMCFSLREFNEREVKELVRKYELNLDDNDIGRLIDELSGHPYLTHEALKFIKENNQSLDFVLENASTEAGIYRDHLQAIWASLERNDDLLRDLKKVVTSPPVGIPSSFKLDRMGLIRLPGNLAESRCEVYRRYFQHRLEHFNF